MSSSARDDACWTVPECEFRGLTPERARDLIVECFFQAQHETFERAKQRVGSADTDPKAIRAAVIGAIRVAFKESGGDFDRPTPTSLGRMVEVLARKAGAWGTPDEIVAHHRAQIDRMLTVLGASSG